MRQKVNKRRKLILVTPRRISRRKSYLWEGLGRAPRKTE